MSRFIYIFRHGQTDWNAEGRIQGHIDIPLNDTGRLQARKLAPVLQKLGIEAFLSSDLSRASETAQIIANQMGGLPVFMDQDLREIHLGKIEGLSRTEIEKLLGVEFSDRLRSDPLSDSDVTLLGSESAEQVTSRALRAVRRFFEQNSYQTIGIATHGGVIRRVIQHALKNGDYPAPIPNGIVYPFSYSESETGKTNLTFDGITKLTF